MQVNWSYSDSETLRSFWLLNQLSAELPLWARERIFSRPQSGDSYLRLFLEIEGLRDQIVVSVLEDEVESAEAAQTALLYGGAGIVFDLNMAHSALLKYAYSTSGSDANKLFRAAYGSEAPPVGDYQVRTWPTTAFERAFPLMNPCLQSLGLIFVFTGAQERLAKSVYGSSLAVERIGLPLILASPEAVRAESLVLRQILRFHPNELVIGLSSTHRERRSAEELCLALTAFKDEDYKCLWLLRAEEDEVSARRVMEKFGMENRIKLLRLSSHDEWKSFHSVFDLACCLDFDPLSGPSLSAIHSLEHGVPLLVSFAGFGRELPSAAALQVAPDRYFQQTLVAKLSALAQSPVLLSGLREGVGRFVKESSPERFAATFLDRLEFHGSELISSARQREERLRRTTSELLVREFAQRHSIADSSLSPGVAESLSWKFSGRGQLRGV